ncbi:MAG: phycobilisome protein, partial [Symploca sp. SIO3C6]|nr:phycobilisome protein [Symploca sp. SIO3C6]
MYAINSDIAQKCIEADGRYLNHGEMQTLEKYIDTYQTRLATYQALRKGSNQFVIGALKKLSRQHPDLIRNHGKRCHYDMTTTLRYLALAILRDDALFFQDSVVIWLDSVLVAHQRHHQCAEAYRYLFEEISEYLPPQAIRIISPYTEE